MRFIKKEGKNDVEIFLHDFKRFSNYIKLYKILK